MRTNKLFNVLVIQGALLGAAAVPATAAACGFPPEMLAEMQKASEAEQAEQTPAPTVVLTSATVEVADPASAVASVEEVEAAELEPADAESEPVTTVPMPW